MRLANFFGITPPLTTSPHPPPTISHYKKQTHDLPNSFIHSWIWKLTTLPKSNTFYGFFLYDKLPTASLLHNRNIWSTAICKICYNHTEDIQHIFLYCKNAFAPWKHFEYISPSHDFSTWLQHQCTTNNLIHTTSHINLPSSILTPVILRQVYMAHPQSQCL